MEQKKDDYVVEGYLINYFGERISQDFREHTKARSFKEAERNVIFRIKSKIGLRRSDFAKLVQRDGIHNTYRTIYSTREKHEPKEEW